VEEGIGHETEALRIGENLAHHFLCTRYVAKKGCVIKWNVVI
jgi:hypothetical protein